MTWVKLRQENVAHLERHSKKRPFLRPIPIKVSTLVASCLEPLSPALHSVPKALVCLNGVVMFFAFSAKIATCGSPLALKTDSESQKGWPYRTLLTRVRTEPGTPVRAQQALIRINAGHIEMVDI